MKVLCAVDGSDCVVKQAPGPVLKAWFDTVVEAHGLSDAPA